MLIQKRFWDLNVFQTLLHMLLLRYPSLTFRQAAIPAQITCLFEVL